MNRVINGLKSLHQHLMNYYSETELEDEHLFAVNGAINMLVSPSPETKITLLSEPVGMAPIAMRLRCPSCNEIHVDEPPWDTKDHHTHACQNCGEVWRPAIENTRGVQFLPGFKNER